MRGSRSIWWRGVWVWAGSPGGCAGRAASWRWVTQATSPPAHCKHGSIPAAATHTGPPALPFPPRSRAAKDCQHQGSIHILFCGCKSCSEGKPCSQACAVQSRGLRTHSAADPSRPQQPQGRRRGCDLAGVTSHLKQAAQGQGSRSTARTAANLTSVSNGPFQRIRQGASARV